MAMDYKSAGVDIEKGDALVDWLKSESSQVDNPFGKVLSGIGGFAALYEPQFASMEKPVLVSATDGIGTKVKLAVEYEQFEGVGQDLVAMCVNDLICVGATPLFFLDYYATGRLQPEWAKQFLKGVRDACTSSGCSLIGGETAEMPGVYQQGDFDAAGFCVGVVDAPKVIQPGLVEDGDVVLGVSSNGFHSNGYSLLRKLFQADMDKWSDQLLRPTHLYVELFKKLQAAPVEIHGMAHITGGGVDNLLRVLPMGAVAKLEPWPIDSMVSEAKNRANMSWLEMLNTFNCGVGLMIVVPPAFKQSAQSVIEGCGFSAFDLGTLALGQGDQAPKWTMDESQFPKGGK